MAEQKLSMQPAHAEAVETLPGLWRKKAAETNDRAMKAWYLGFASELEAALAARPAAVGAVIEVVEQREAEAKRLEPDAKGWTMGWVDCANGYSAAIRQALAAQPQQLAVTGEDALDTALTAYNRADHQWTKRGEDDRDEPSHRFAMRAALAALPHLARKETSDG